MDSIAGLSSLNGYYPQFAMVIAEMQMQGGVGGLSAGRRGFGGAGLGIGGGTGFDGGVDRLALSEEMMAGGCLGMGAGSAVMMFVMMGERTCPCEMEGMRGLSGSGAPQAPDPYGKAQSGVNQSNMTNDPQAMLALNSLLANGGGGDFSKVAKELQQKYGMQVGVGTVDKDGHVTSIQDPNQDPSQSATQAKGNPGDKQALIFPGGSYFVDGNGNGTLDAGDYNFKDAITNLQNQYGTQTIKNIEDQDDAIAKAPDQPNTQNNVQNPYGGFGGRFGGFGGGPGMGPLSGYGSGGPGMGGLGGGNPMLMMQELMMLVEMMQAAQQGGGMPGGGFGMGGFGMGGLGMGGLGMGGGFGMGGLGMGGGFGMGGLGVGGGFGNPMLNQQVQQIFMMAMQLVMQMEMRGGAGVGMGVN